MKPSCIPLLRTIRVLLLVFAPFIFPALPALHADLNHEQVAAAKAATGLLVTSDGSGSAFCISESGLFVTCDHVLEGARPDDIAIVLSPTGKDEKRFPATIVRRLKDQDIAILKVTPDRKLPVLKLGNVAGLFETEQLYVFGYPFGKALALDEKSYPSISVNVGRITSLRKKGDTLDVIQLDAQVNPGNSGGPVLDGDGNVVGIVAAGLIASGINFAIPVSDLGKSLEAPVITVTAPEANNAHLNSPVEFTVAVDWLAPSTQDSKVSIEVRGDGQPRRFDAAKGNDGKFRAKIVPARKSDKADKANLHVTLDFGSGEISGTISDRKITVANQPKAISEIHVLERDPSGQSFLADGQPAGSLAELKALAVDIGGTTTTVDARKASRIEIRKPDAPIPSLSYQALVKLTDGKEFSSDEIRFDGHPSPQPSIPTSTSVAKRGPVPTPPITKQPKQPRNPVPPPPVLSGKVDLPAMREIALASPISDVVAAQHGRTLLLHMKEVKKVAVFDVIDLAIRGYINLVDDRAVIAGGAKYMLVASPGENLLQRYSLDTLKLDRTITNSFGNVTSLTMGRSSPGLALMIAGNSSPGGFNVMAFDAESMTVVATAERNIAMQMYSPNATVRASAEGRTFGVYRPGLSPSGFTILNFHDNELSQFYEHVSPGVLVPNADGSQIFTSSSGIYTDKYAPLIEGSGNWASGVTYLPSYHPKYFLSVPYNYISDKKATNTIGIFLEGTSRALLQMSEEFKEMRIAKQGAGRGDPITADKRYHFYPQLNLLLTIPPTNNKIVARPLNILSLLDQKGIDYLYVLSTAPLGQVSAPYRYKLEAASRAGKVKFALQSGPPGLTISADGAVAWKAPAEPKDETVIVSLKDASGQETLHTFHVVTTQ